MGLRVSRRGVDPFETRFYPGGTGTHSLAGKDSQNVCAKHIELSHRMVPGKEHFKLEVCTFDVTELLSEVKHRPDIWYVLSQK